LPKVIFLEVRTENRRFGWILGRGTEKPLDQRTEKDDSAHDRRDGIARQAKGQHSADTAEHQWLARAHGDAPEVQRHPLGRQGVAHEVVVADRGAADGQQYVGVVRRGPIDRRFDGGAAVGNDAEVRSDFALTF
jgi:hypothetical protein